MLTLITVQCRDHCESWMLCCTAICFDGLVPVRGALIEIGSIENLCWEYLIAYPQITLLPYFWYLDKLDLFSALFCEILFYSEPHEYVKLTILRSTQFPLLYINKEVAKEFLYIFIRYFDLDWNFIKFRSVSKGKRDFAANMTTTGPFESKVLKWFHMICLHIAWSM